MLVKVKTKEKTLLIMYENICYISKEDDVTIITMCNNEKIHVISPPYNNWEADLFNQKT